jgi:hypothetical protein
MVGPKKYCIIILMVVVPIFCCSCPVPLYFPSRDLGSARIDTSDIRPGVTTKEDVLLRYGNSFYTIDDNEQLFRTAFTDSDKFVLFLVFGAGYTGFGIPAYGKEFNAFYEIEIEFDDNDVVKRCETFKLPREQNADQK